MAISSPLARFSHRFGPAAGGAPDFLTFLRRFRERGFTLTAMAFQDAMNLDAERLRRCSLHVYSNGTLKPFCANYLTAVTEHEEKPL